MCLASDTQFSDFLDGMGPAQFVGRQTLATTSMGERDREPGLDGFGSYGGWRGEGHKLLFPLKVRVPLLSVSFQTRRMEGMGIA